MRSVLMQLRKCCNHAFLLDGVEEEHAFQVCSHFMLLSISAVVTSRLNITGPCTLHCICAAGMWILTSQCHRQYQLKQEVTGAEVAVEPHMADYGIQTALLRQDVCIFACMCQARH